MRSKSASKNHFGRTPFCFTIHNLENKAIRVSFYTQYKWENAQKVRLGEKCAPRETRKTWFSVGYFYRVSLISVSVPHWALFVTEFRCECIVECNLFAAATWVFYAITKSQSDNFLINYKFSELILSNCCDFCYIDAQNPVTCCYVKIVLLTFLLVPKNQALILNIRILNK